MGDYLYNRTQREDEVMTIIDYEFQDRDRLWEALQGKGSLVTHIGGRPVPENNRMLALLGDKMIGFIIIRDERRKGRTIGSAKQICNADVPQQADSRQDKRQGASLSSPTVDDSKLFATALV
ncbi:hypothetical protein CGCSCA1_v005512 [Colletotrichum siamense]|nr:hypothetical protein CGCSCA1_v005512 [Colletotrichum siamense]